MTDTCLNCAYWDKGTFYSDNDLGLCRINPPIPEDKDRGYGIWPVIKERDWCGEFKPAGKE